MQIELAGGFTDAVIGAQSTFRAAMNALARPGSIQEIASEIFPPVGLCVASAALALALFDHDTPVWLDAHLQEQEAVTAWLRFHTGCPFTDDRARAAMAVIDHADADDAFAGFALGTPDYPDRSTTLIVQVAAIGEGERFRLQGPGLSGTTDIQVAGLPADFVARRADNRAQFPRGVDLILVAGNAMVALPRTTVVTN